MSLQRTRLLVTGASGFIASRVALHLQRLGIDAVFTGRDANDIERDRLRELADAGIEVRLGDLRDADFVRSLVADRTAVLHLAAAQHEGHMSDQYFRSVNVDATRLLLEASAAAGVKRFVYGGTIGIHGSSQHGPISEDSRPDPRNIYTRTKLAAEAVVGEFAPQMETVICRIGEAYGPGDLRLLKLFKAVERGRFVMIGSGDNERQPIYVDDLIRGLLAGVVRREAIGQTILLTGNERMTTRDMVVQVARAVDKPAPSWRVPMWPVLAAAVASHALMRPLGLRTPLQPRSLDFFRKSFVFSTSKAQTLLGVEPAVRFLDGARATLAWYRSHGYMADHPAPVLSSAAHI